MEKWEFIKLAKEKNLINNVTNWNFRYFAGQGHKTTPITIYLLNLKTGEEINLEKINSKKIINHNHICEKYCEKIFDKYRSWLIESKNVLNR